MRAVGAFGFVQHGLDLGVHRLDRTLAALGDLGVCQPVAYEFDQSGLGPGQIEDALDQVRIAGQRQAGIEAEDHRTRQRRGADFSDMGKRGDLDAERLDPAIDLGADGLLARACTVLPVAEGIREEPGELPAVGIVVRGQAARRVDAKGVIDFALAVEFRVGHDHTAIPVDQTDPDA